MDHTVQVWDVINSHKYLTYRGHTDQINTVAWSPNGKYIASGSDDHTMQIWDATTKKTVFTSTNNLTNYFAVTKSVAWSPDGKLIASGSSDSTVRFWATPYPPLLGLYFSIEEFAS
ncbi:hypothetical protein KSB_65290 [Ktedonobacter robiniae]|uniref:Anaphase-promoting complex subunit 4 WD40 domain-containing protein n=2 Tax=Ktedonobacter robiniae TaxID=2778365 RepID=A0ABQ3UYU8_9CHLR|nr:hypothetical protein KSB_65290 [Ktedonobacter robiniae]